MTTFNVMTINIGLKGKNSKADKRRTAYLKAIKSEDPDIILLQEVTTKKDLQSINNQSDGGYNYYLSTGEAKVMSKFELFTVIRVTFNDRDMEARQPSDRITHADIKQRVELVKLTRKSDDLVIYIASWHGQYKITDTKKKDQLDAFLKIIDKKCGNNPTIIGGDFNLSYDKAKGTIKKTKFDAHFLKESPIDYFLTYNVKVEGDVQTYEYSEDEKELLDHNPLIITTELETQNPIKSTFSKSKSIIR